MRAPWITELWFRSGSEAGKSCAELLQRLESRQHGPESQGGDDGDARDRTQAGEGA
jgi:hypothetical protein